MLMVEKKPKRNRVRFRNTLNKLMVARDIFQWKDLRAELERNDYDISQSRLSQYLNGSRNPEELEEFFDAIGRTLGLTREEKMLLAYSYAYPETDEKPTNGELPGGARSPEDLREGLDAAAKARENKRTGGRNGRGADRGGGT